MITNLRENFLYEKLPAAVIDLDERGLLEAVVGGFQDHLEDLRSFTSKLGEFYVPGAFPETGNNAVLVDLQSDQGKAYTRSLEITDETPPNAGPSLNQWAATQLGLDVTQVSNVRYGVDPLRRIDASTLTYLADTLGAILYQSTLVPDAQEAAMQQRLVDTWFPRLKIKGTVQSFEVLGRILGFDDVRMTPLWSRVSPRKPEDVGAPVNDPDFAAVPEYVPQQQLSPFYNPLETRDGPFFTWTGTVSKYQASTQFYSQVINGFSPFISVQVVTAQHGTVAHPATGSYALAGGDAYTKAKVIPPNSGVQFRALVEGDAYNGLYVHVTSGTGSNAVLSVTDRLSSVKYRASYFDLGLTADMDRVAEIFGDTAVKKNKDIANGTNTVDGVGTSPYRPWVSGSVALPLVPVDWTTETVVSNGSVSIRARRQAGPTDRELDIQSLTAAGVQVMQALEEVRPATRFPRRTSTGFLIDDRVPYAFYGTQSQLFTTNSVNTVYSGSYALTPLPDYIASIQVVTGLFVRVWWFSTPGETYWVDFSPTSIPTSSPTGWTQIAEIVASGPTSEFFYAIVGVPMAFFRIRTTYGPPFYGFIQLVSGKNYPATAAVDPDNESIWHYRYADPLVTNVVFTGSYNFDTGYYYFNFTPPVSGSKVLAYWTLTSTEVVRPEPSYSVKFSGAIASLPRPEDDENICSFYGSEFVNGQSYFGTYYRCVGYETIDEYPWRRDIVNGGEVVEVDAYLPVAPDVAVQAIDPECVFVDHTGCEYSVYAIKSTVSSRMRYRTEPRATDSTYTPGSLPIGYQGTFKNLAALTPVERAMVNSLTDAETLFNPGYALYHVGLAQGVLVADAPKFFGPHHRQNLIGWLPFNEHPEDALEVVDHSGINSTQYLQSVDFLNRQWDDAQGWYLNLPAYAAITSPNYRDWADDQTVSFWFKAGAGSGVATVVAAGAIHFDYDADAQTMSGYVGDKLIGGFYAATDTWAFVYVRKNLTSAWFGGANLHDTAIEANRLDDFIGASDTDQLAVYAGSTVLGLHDLRIWNALKTVDEMELVRYHAPNQTIVNYTIGFMYTANRQDRYGLLVLPNGWVTTGDLPASVRHPAMALVRRYDEMGLYQGQSRFKETGLGGGHSLPALYQLGVQYGAMTSNGTAVVATEHGQLPGVNDLWLENAGAGTYFATGTSVLGNWILDKYVPALPVIINNTSGIAYHPPTDTLICVRNGPSAPGNMLYRYDTNGAWLQTITLVTGGANDFIDCESVCWVSGSTFAVVDEDTSQITVFPIDFSTVSITKAHWLSIDTGFGNLDVSTGGGFEGLTYDRVRNIFWVAKERQSAAPVRVGMRIYTVGWTGSVSEPFSAYMTFPPNITDISDLFHDQYRDRLYVLSDEAKAIIEVTPQGQVLEISNLPQGMTQPEGITFDLTTGTRLWLAGENAQLRGYVKGAYNAYGTLVPTDSVESGTYSPWPNVQHETNPNRDLIWVAGTDSYVYEIVLDGTLTNTLLSAKKLAYQRTDAEITVNPVYSTLLTTGTYYSAWTTGWMSGTLVNGAGTIQMSGTGGVNQTTVIAFGSLALADQPTGAHATLVQNGTYLTVTKDGVVILKPGSTDPDTPPLYMYCNSRIKAYALNGTAIPQSAWYKWTDKLNNASQQHLDVSAMPSIVNPVGGNILLPAIGAAGLIEFSESGVLTPGRYSLKVESGNIGQTDADFDGFNVEITVNATILEKRLLADRSGYNVRGFDTFEFDLADRVNGNYLLSFLWTNPYRDEATNTMRQLAVYSYELRQLSTELYKVTTGLSAPTVTKIGTEVYSVGTTPGGWLLSINSYGTLAAWAHEAAVYPANDTIASKQPLSSILTGMTGEKREDIMLPAAEFVVPQEGSYSFPVMSGVLEVVVNGADWMTSGGITPDGDAVITAKIQNDSSQVRVAVCTERSFTQADIVYSAMQVASQTANRRVVNCPVHDLTSGTQYFYAIETDGTLNNSFTGTFNTWGRGVMDFSFVFWACENSTALVSPSWPIISASDPLFMFNCGDLHYSNIATNNDTLFYNAYNTVFSTGTRKTVFSEIPFVYVWDDHDMGPNDSDKTSPSIPAARRTYRQAVPHYQLPAGDDAPIYFTFEVGRAKFIVSDLRSERDLSNTANYQFKTMMGEPQKEWFKQEVLKANADPNVGVIFWVTSVPWTGAAGADDHWAGYANERTELSNFFKQNGVHRFFILHGDEHSQSIDDGRYTDFATGTVGTAGTGHGWPCFGVAPLGQGISVKAGSRMIGPMWMSNPAYQFGIVSVHDAGTDIYVTFRGVYETGATVNNAGTNMLWQFNGTESPRP